MISIENCLNIQKVAITSNTLSNAPKDFIAALSRIIEAYNSGNLMELISTFNKTKKPLRVCIEFPTGELYKFYGVYYKSTPLYAQGLRSKYPPITMTTQGDTVVLSVGSTKPHQVSIKESIILPTGKTIYKEDTLHGIN